LPHHEKAEAAFISMIVTLVIVVLVLINTLYVAAEFSAVSVRRSRLEELARDGNRAARLLTYVIRNPAALDRYVAACQIGITLSSLVLGAYGQATLAGPLAPQLSAVTGLDADTAESVSVVGVLIGLTVLQVILGELVPKSIALQYPTKTALVTTLPMRASLWLFRPFIAVLNGSGVKILRWLGMGAEGSHRHIHSPEELELLIAESRDGGLLEPVEHQRLHQALRLSLRSAGQLMVPRPVVVGLDVQWSSARILDAVIASPHTRLPVYDGSIDRTLGVVHVRDVATTFARNRNLETLRQSIRPVPAVPESMPADRLLRTLRESRSHQALVVNEYGAVAGLITLQDVVAELLGEVRDEFQSGVEAIQVLPDGRVRLSGQLSLADAPEWLGRRWRSEAHTVAGHVIRALKRLPQQGERVNVGGVDVEVERLEGRVPATLVVTPIATAEADRG
jgi:CBS domain containing-hemolysin-like protein